MNEQEMQKYLTDHVAALANKHVSVSYALIGILGAILVLGSIGGYIGLKFADAQLARQDAKDALYQQDRKTFLDSLVQHDADRAADMQRIADLEAQISKRDAKPLPKPIQDGIKPGATAQEAANALQSVMTGTPSFGFPTAKSDGTIALSVPQTQELVKDEVGYQRLKLDFSDTQAILGLEKQANLSLSNDLKQCTALNVKANADIEGYKKLAKKTKWQKFLGGAEKALLFAGGMYLGHKI